VYDALLAIWAQPTFLVLQVPLFAAVLYHALNGIRVIIIDFWNPGSRYQERLFWAVLVLFFVLFIPGAIIMLSLIFR
ncbi:MAG: succinate dehydrogenase, cytochrome b556 subunit, partial [Chloroflexota bacterium]